MASRVHLKQFDEDELILDEHETIEILKFFFRNKHDMIEQMHVDNDLREFAQGLLVEAVDASYSFGFIEILFKSLLSPRPNIRRILKKFGKKASKHWFKHATARDLTQIKIYDRVRERLALNFRPILRMHYNGTAGNLKVNGAFLTYTAGGGPRTVEKVWKLT